MDGMTVSELGRRVGISAHTIRYYERIGLLPEADRSAAGYRLFGDDDVGRVAFIKRAQRFGLRLDEIRQLLEVRERGLCPCGHARDLLVEKLGAIEEQLGALAALRDDIRSHLAGEPTGDGGAPWPCGDELVRVQPRPERRVP